jgi:hypothetical protein
MTIDSKATIKNPPLNNMLSFIDNLVFLYTQTNKLRYLTPKNLQNQKVITIKAPNLSWENINVETTTQTKTSTLKVQRRKQTPQRTQLKPVITYIPASMVRPPELDLRDMH